MSRQINITPLASRRAYNAAAALLANGIFPGPRLMHHILRGWAKNNLNGAECHGRSLALEDAGYVKNDCTGRWGRPDE